MVGDTEGRKLCFTHSLIHSVKQWRSQDLGDARA